MATPETMQPKASAPKGPPPEHYPAIFAELQDEKGEAPVGLRSAALLCALIVSELGAAKAAKMTRAEVKGWAQNIRHRYPLVWAAARRQDLMGLVRFLRLAKLEHESVDEYQAAMGRLLAAQPKAGA